MSTEKTRSPTHTKPEQRQNHTQLPAPQANANSDQRTGDEPLRARGRAPVPHLLPPPVERLPLDALGRRRLPGTQPPCQAPGDSGAPTSFLDPGQSQETQDLVSHLSYMFFL